MARATHIIMKTANTIKKLFQTLPLNRTGNLMLLIPVILSTARAEEVKYLDIQDLAHRFDLQEQRINPETIHLQSRMISMRLTALENECVLNSLTLGLIHPVTKSGETLMVSAADVENTLAPILQPRSLINRGPVRLVLVEVEDRERRSDLSGPAIEREWVDLIVAALGEGMATRRNSIILKMVGDGSLENAVSEIKEEDREGAVLIRLHCEGNPEVPITVKTFAPANSPPEREQADAGVKHGSADSIAFAAAVQGSVGLRLGEHLRDGRVDWAQLPDIARLGLPAIRLVVSPPDATEYDNNAIEPYAKAVAMGMIDGILKFEGARAR